MEWIQAVSSRDLEEKGRMVVRHGARQIALFHHQNHIYAADNRCPHEGYPLSEGSLPAEGCVLTCNWHNWRFDLTTGECLLGEDHVNVYETRSEDGLIYIGIPEIPKEVIGDRILRNLQAAFEEQQFGRIARELARLHFNGIDPVIGVRKAIEWAYNKLEFGMDHSFAVTADWLTLYHELQDREEKLVCLTEAIDYVSESALRMPEFPYTEKRIPYTPDSFLAAIESKNEESAVAQILQAHSAGLRFGDLEEVLSEAALKHYNDFGHSLIWVVKVGKLVEHLGADVEPLLLPPLVRSICLATREDLLPEFKALPELGRSWVDNGHGNPAPGRVEDLYGLGMPAALQWVVRQAKSRSPESMYFALLQANAWSLLHYNLDLQYTYSNPVSKNIGWLDFTHGITFASAVRKQCSKFPKLWTHGLLQMACFVGRNHSFLDRTVRDEDWFVADEEAFHRKAAAQLLDHGHIAPIFAAHYVKTYLAAREEAALAPASCEKYVLASVRRFLESPLREKHVRRTVHQALSLVSKDFEL